MREVKSLADANTIIRELQDRVSFLIGNVIDFRGRRISNASDAVDLKDYVTKSQLDNAIASVNVEITKIKTELGFLEKRVKALEP